jgi:hypothetical protein
MWGVTHAITALGVGLILAVLPASGPRGQPSAAQPPRTRPVDGARPEAVGLTVHEGRLSLRAQEVSLKAIFDAIGRQLAIDVVTRIPADERITLAFAPLPLAEALTRFRPYVHYLIVEDAQAPGTVRQLIVVSKRAAGRPPPPSQADGEGVVPHEQPPGDGPTSGAPGRPQPFRFEFDPTAVGGWGR